jgi:hypothetical protein
LRSGVRAIQYQRGAIHFGQINAIKIIAAHALFYWAATTFVINNAIAQPAEIANAQNAGQARLKVLGFQIYDAQLWVTTGFKPEDYANSGFALELTYLRNFDGDAIAKRSIKEMRRIDSFSDAQSAQWLADMQKTFPDVKKGDRLTGIYKPGIGVRFLLNGKPIGDVDDPQFARLFFGIWLSPKTSEPQMRSDLLRNTALEPK